jgi:hypothetical protein
MKRTIVRIVISSMLSIVASVYADGSLVVDSAVVVDSAIDTVTVADSTAPEDTATIHVSPVSPPLSNRARLLLVNGRFNIESLESDVFDGDYDDSDEEPSVLLGNDTPSGFGFMIPGGIFTTVGAIVMSILFSERSFSPTPEEFNGSIVVGSLLTTWSVASFTIGFHQLHRHLHLDNRYMLPELHYAPVRPRTSETAPVMIRRGSKGVISP